MIAGRVGLLGTLLKPVLTPKSNDRPYIIGITGMLASGKSSVCRRLETLGAYRLDADKLGHFAYVPKTKDHDEGPAYKGVIEHFGTGSSSTGFILFETPSRSTNPTIK